MAAHEDQAELIVLDLAREHRLFDVDSFRRLRSTVVFSAGRPGDRCRSPRSRSVI